MNNEWKVKPIELEEIPDDIDYIFVIDENGSFGNFKALVNKYKCGYRLENVEKYFTLTGILISCDEYVSWKQKINDVKNKYWQDGCWYNKKKNKVEKIHFHSSDTFSRHPKAPFNLSKESFNNLMMDIVNCIDTTNFKIISSNINIQALMEKYGNPFDPYTISIEFILERLVLKLRKLDSNAIVVFESRKCQDNLKGDNKVHRKAIEFYSTGKAMYGNMDSLMLRKIKGIYFNPKLNTKDCLNSYEFIELVDLVTYPIYKMFKTNFEQERKDYKIIEPKFDNYPNHNGHGLKIFP